eukprot:scaffold37864_cov22-Tisochrysis_lutea.AAC.1
MSFYCLSPSFLCLRVPALLKLQVLTPSAGYACLTEHVCACREHKALPPALLLPLCHALCRPHHLQLLLLLQKERPAIVYARCATLDLCWRKQQPGVCEEDAWVALLHTRRCRGECAGIEGGAVQWWWNWQARRAWHEGGGGEGADEGRRRMP